MTLPESTESPSRSLDSGLACLVMLARFHGVAADPAQLQHEFCATSQHFELGQILLAAKKLGLKARQVKSSIERLPLVPLPAMALDVDGNYFVIAQVDGERVLIHDPRAERPQVLTQQELQARWLGKLVLFASRASLAGQLARFDFSWFIPAMVKYRKLLGEVLLMSFFLQLFALVSPLFFQVVMDKVLVHQGFTTLDVICIGLLVISVFEVLLGGVRTYLFAHTTNRIDVELGARLFRHLLALPLAYFEARRVGDSVARIRELENIRNFLTGQALTSVLDLLFSVVFIAVMLVYSFWLTMIVVVSLPCYFLISALITPLLRARLNEKFNRGAENQAFLVESVNGIQTLKAMAVEPQATRHWDNQLAAYVAAGFRVVSLANWGNQSVSLINKLTTVATLWLGAKLVIAGDLSVGQLIAFNMLAGRVAAPVMRLAQLWQDFQQTGISVARLGDIGHGTTAGDPHRRWCGHRSPSLAGDRPHRQPAGSRSLGREQRHRLCEPATTRHGQD